jgi:hypothetical protein
MTGLYPDELPPLDMRPIARPSGDTIGEFHRRQVHSGRQLDSIPCASPSNRSILHRAIAGVLDLGPVYPSRSRFRPCRLAAWALRTHGPVSVRHRSRRASCSPSSLCKPPLRRKGPDHQDCRARRYRRSDRRTDIPPRPFARLLAGQVMPGRFALPDTRSARGPEGSVASNAPP